jgi:hypothetical protein
MNPATATNADLEHTFGPPEDAIGGDGQPGPRVGLSADAARGTVESLLRLEEFFRRHADQEVHAQLRAYCAGLGWHPACGADALLDRLGLHAWSLQQALDAAEAAPGDHTRCTGQNTTVKETA